MSLSNKLPFLHLFNSKSSRKMYGFSLSLYILHVLSLVYLNLWVVDLIWDICCFGDGLDECLLCLDFWVLLIRLLGFYFCFHGWYWLSMSIDLFDIWISYPLCYDLFLVYSNALHVCCWLIQDGWAICLNCLWLSCVLLLSYGYCLLCVGLNTLYSLCHIS